MKGTIYKSTSRHGRTTWRYMIDAGRDEQGKRIRPSESGFRLEREAMDAMNAVLRDLRGGRVGTAGTFGEFLTRWLPYHTQAKQLAPKTAERYPSLAAHAIRALGHIPLKNLTPFVFDDLYVKLAQTPQPKTGRTLSPKTIREVHNVVRVALKRAVKTKLLAFNPADGVDLPRITQKEARALNAAQMVEFQRTATGSWVDLLIRLAGALGARRGELLACRWSDLNWSTSTMRIERSLYQVKQEIGIKSTKQRTARDVSVPPSLMAYLKMHKEQQDQNAALVGPDYRHDLDLIFAGPAGEYLLPSSVTRAAVRLAKKAGLSGIGLHSLRHSHASALLHAGVPITNVAKRLGHRDAHTTARIYAHALPDTDQDTALIWDKLMAKKPRQPKLRAQLGTTRDADLPVKN